MRAQQVPAPQPAGPGRRIIALRDAAARAQAPKPTRPLPLEERNGASVWTAGSYDPDLNLVYFGVDTLALNPDTGRLVWYFQHVPNDQWDLDWVFERQVIPLAVNGTTGN